MQTTPTSPFALIASDMQATDALIVQNLSSQVPLVEQVGQYITQAGGKRLRPALLLFMSQALGYEGVDRFALAAVIEFIHTATLLHDDVVDESTLRRSQATANAQFGNAASVLVGDFLYSRAFQMMVAHGNMRVMEVLADVTNVVAEGEVLQLMHMQDTSLSVDDYRQVVYRKTAKLFEASTQLAAILAKTTPTLEAQCAAYGSHLGTAFQVVDDVLDYSGESDKLGKNLGDDLREGKVTLPLIIAMQRGPSEPVRAMQKAIESVGGDDETQAFEVTLQQALALIEQTDAIAASMEVARREAELAIEQVFPVLPTSPARDALVELAQSLLKRNV